MNKKDLSKYFTAHALGRVPIYKAAIALCCSLLVVATAGAGIAVTAVSASSAGSAEPIPTPMPTPVATVAPTPTPSPTPSPTPTPEPVQVVLDVSAIQQSIGITVMDKEKGIPVLGEDFEVTLKYTPPKKTDKDAKDKDEIKQKEISTYHINPKSGTLLVEKVAVGDYKITLEEREGFVKAKPVSISVKEKVEYKADTEAVKDKIKDESQVGKNDIVSDNKVIQDENASGEVPSIGKVESDYENVKVTATERKEKVYAINDKNFKVENGKQYLLDNKGNPTCYYVSKTQVINGIEVAVEATLDKGKYDAQNKAAASAVIESAANTAKALFMPFRLDRLFVPAAWADELPAEPDSAAAPSETTSIPSENQDDSITSEVTSSSEVIPDSTPDENATPESNSTSEATSESTSNSASNSTSEVTSGSTSNGNSSSTSGSTSNSTSGSTSNSTSGSAPEETPAPTPLKEVILLYNVSTNTPVVHENLMAPATEIIVEVTRTGWYTNEKGQKFFYDQNGKMVTRECVIDGKKCVFAEDGSLKSEVEQKPAAVVKGIDVSKYQRNIDWKAVKASGIDFAIIRVGYRGYGTGALVEDSYFRQNIQGATAAGLKVGLYFYSQAVNEAEAVEEASMVLRLCKGYPISYPIYFDTEKVANASGRADGISKSQRTANAVAFCETIRNAGYRPGVYSYASWFYNQLNMANLTKYSVWIAQYRENLSFNYGYDIWQYTSSGNVPGVPGRCDMNVSKLG